MPGKSRRILGIDPGYGRMGWAVIDVAGQRSSLCASGCLTTKKNISDATRLELLYDELRVIIAKWQPTIAALERLYFQRNTSTAIGVGQARGAALLVCGQSKMDIHEFSPTDVKLSTAGYGRADKRQMTKMVCLLLGLEKAPRTDDEADAMAIALCAGVYRPAHAL